MSGIYRGVLGSAIAYALQVDGDKGDLTVSGGGSVLTIDNDVVTYAKIQNVSATDKLLGRSSVGAGDIEEITCTQAGRDLLDDATASDQRTTLGLGALATQGYGDKGDLTISSSGLDWTINPDKVTFAKMQNISTNTVLGRATTGSGDVEEIPCTSAGRALLDDADASAQRTTLGLGALATQGDGDKGDITVSASGATWTIDNNAITTAKIATDAVTNSKIAFDGGSLGFRNKLIGGSATTNPWQQGTSFISTTTPANNDDTYTADQWYLLTDGIDIVDFTQSTDAPTGSLYSFQFDVETANKKFGFAQIIEQKNCQALIGGVASLSFKAKVTGSSLTNIKAAVVSWSGTADTVTSDIISAWNADGATPTLIANATFENTPANLSVTTSWAEYKIENIAIDTASTKNLIVFIWCDNATTTIGDLLNIENVQLEQGSVATAFEATDFASEFLKCARYYYKQGLYVAALTGGNAVTGVFYKARMRTSPSVSGGGAGFTLVANSQDGTYFYQDTTGSPTLIFDSRL